MTQFSGFSRSKVVFRIHFSIASPPRKMASHLKTAAAEGKKTRQKIIFLVKSAGFHPRFSKSLYACQHFSFLQVVEQMVKPGQDVEQEVLLCVPLRAEKPKLNPFRREGSNKVMMMTGV